MNKGSSEIQSVSHPPSALPARAFAPASTCRFPLAGKQHYLAFTSVWRLAIAPEASPIRAPGRPTASARS